MRVLLVTPPKAKLEGNGGTLTQPLVHTRWNSIDEANGKSKTHWDESKTEAEFFQLIGGAGFNTDIHAWIGCLPRPWRHCGGRCVALGGLMACVGSCFISNNGSSHGRAGPSA